MIGPYGATKPGIIRALAIGCADLHCETLFLGSPMASRRLSIIFVAMIIPEHPLLATSHMMMPDSLVMFTTALVVDIWREQNLG